MKEQKYTAANTPAQRRPGEPEEIGDPPVPEETPPQNGEDMASSRRLEFRMKRIRARRLTIGGDSDDELIATGGYAYDGGGRGPLRQFRRDFKLNDEIVLDGKKANGEMNDPEHTFIGVSVVPNQLEKVFLATVLCFEEDVLKPSTAAAIGIFQSLVLTAGVELAVRYLTTTPGLPQELTEQARDLLEKEGINGVRSWFETLVGPEALEPFAVKAITSWPQGQDVRWESYITDTPRQRRTRPFRSTGPKLHEGDVATIQEVTFEENDSDEVVLTVISNGGLYELDMVLEVL